MFAPPPIVVENKGVIFGIRLRSGEAVKLDNGAIVRRTPAAIEGIASNEAVSQVLEAVPRSPGGLDDDRNWVFFLRTSRNHDAVRLWLFAPVRQWTEAVGDEPLTPVVSTSLRLRFADPDIPILKQAKAEYAKLQQSSADPELASKGRQD